MGSTQAMYSNLIPALFFPAQMANNQKPTGGYIAVSMPTSFNQQPFQLLQPLQGHGPSMVYPGSSADSPNLAGINAAKYVSPSSHTRSTPGGTLTEITRGQVELEGGSSPQISLSPELQNSSLSSSIIEETLRDRTRRHHQEEEVSPDERIVGACKKSFTFQRPSSATATSIKAEPGSALESNIESNASISASVKAVKMASPGGFLAASSSRASVSVGLDDHVLETTDSSMCSLLKSSDEFTPSSCNGSEGDMNEKENTPRPNLPDPFWLTNTELTQETIMNYQIKPKSTADILKKDGERLKRMIQPNQVKEQLDQLYREMEEVGETIRPFLDIDNSTSCENSSSENSTGEENDSEINYKNQSQKQVKFERYAIIYGEDAPMPPSLKTLEISRKDIKSSTPSITSSSGDGEKKSSGKMAKSEDEYKDYASSSGGSSFRSSKVGSRFKDHEASGSTSLGSSSAITVEGDSRTSPSDDETIKGCGSSHNTSKIDEGFGSKATSTTNTVSAQNFGDDYN